jgi:hypothetical protein
VGRYCGMTSAPTSKILDRIPERAAY